MKNKSFYIIVGVVAIIAAILIYWLTSTESGLKQRIIMKYKLPRQQAMQDMEGRTIEELKQFLRAGQVGGS